MTGVVLIALTAVIAFLGRQILQLRAEVHASRKNLASVAQHEAGLRTLLGDVSGTLGAIPHAANALAAPQSFSLLERSIRDLVGEMELSRKKMSAVSDQVRSDLVAAAEHHAATVEVLTTRGDVFVKNLAAATTLLAQADDGLRQTTVVSLDLQEALRTNAVSFDMVQELIEVLTQLLPQFRDTAQGFSRLLSMAEERNLFSEKTFVSFEESLARLSRTAEDFSAVARTLTSSLDASLVRIDVTEENEGPVGTAK